MLMVTKEEAIEAHRKRKGKMEIISKVPLTTQNDLATYYTPGVAYVSEAVKQDKELSFEYTNRANSLAIVSDGTRILGLGDIGPEAGMPVMEGKAILFKKFGGVDAIPLCIDTKDEDEIVRFITQITPSFGAINVEDISSPKCFHIVDRLTQSISIPVFHDDQHGTGVVALAGLINAFKLAGKKKDSRIIMFGAGAAGVGISRLLLHMGYHNVIVLDSKGALYEGREDMNDFKAEIAKRTNPRKESGMLEDVIGKADVLVCSTGKEKLDKSIISKMNEKPIVFALTNPYPELEYKEAKAGGAYIAATGRSDMPNQINNVIAFPGIMRGLLDVRARCVDLGILEAAAKAIAKSVGRKLSVENLMPAFSDAKLARKVTANLAYAVADEAIKAGIARVKADPATIKKKTIQMLKRYAKIEKKVLSLS
jgi:malate dehydrogenase (oxaloacetate-decarboxylating)